MSEAADNVTDNAMPEPSAFEMSDEQIANMDMSEFLQVTEASEPEAGDAEGDVADEGTEVIGTEIDETNDEETSIEEESDDVEETNDSTEGDEPDEEENVEDASEEDEGESSELDYEAAYKKILAPFSANGKQMQVENVDEAIQLMQMGANYNKKMAALKPNLKLLKSLENNGLLDESKLNFLIDLDKKNPDAIKKLIKDSGIESEDLDLEDGDYKPTDYSVEEGELQLDSVLNDLEGSQYGKQVVDLVTKTWDGRSKQLVAENPQLLKLLDNHMANGVYEMVSNAVERERVFGRLEGMSDLEAYKQVGDALNAKGAFDSLAKEQSNSERKDIKTKAKAEDPQLKSKKRAAGSVKKAKSAPKTPPKGSLGMSDEDFEKLLPNFI